MAKIKKLVLLVNLGSPHELSVTAIRRFLRQFLGDKRVVGLPRFVWFPILYGIILPIRAKKLLHKYQQIWLENDSPPLVHYTQRQAKLLAKSLSNDEVAIDYAFCYGINTISEKLNSWYSKENINELVIVPLYPQYSSSTTAPVLDQVSNFFRKSYYIPKIKFINSFATNSTYIKALAESVDSFWQQNGKAEKLLVSFHSLPVKLIDNGDSYLTECQQTYHLLCNELGIAADKDAKLAFQSKFGKAKWVEPATDQTIILLAKSGVKRIDVICPGFMSDCLETLEEVAIQYKELFESSGGEELRYIPCLNDSAQAVNLLEHLIN